MMFDYSRLAERLAKKYLKTDKGRERLESDLKEIYNHQCFECFEVVIDNLMRGAYDNREALINIYEFEFNLVKGGKNDK